VLVALNILSLYLHQAQESIHTAEIFLALLVDVGALTAQLYLSGGATNPFVPLYLLQVTLGAVLLEAWAAWSIVATICLCFLWLTAWPATIVIPDLKGGTLANLHVQGMLICLLLEATLLVLFITRINRNLRARDAHLADMRQQSAEEDHIIRLGLLASGAAHELGTPLATLSVILNDWEHMPELATQEDMAEEIAEMQTQVDRCKTILAGILLSSGEVRGEGTLRTSVGDFFDGLAREWRQSRAPIRFVYRNDFAPDAAIVSDAALKQIVYTVLDNALEASPAWMSLQVAREAAAIVVTVRDRGAGFSAAMLDAFGKPYQSTKARAGRGLGLFLVVNVVRKLGGTVTADNDPRGGAVVRLDLPLARLSAAPQEDQDHVG